MCRGCLWQRKPCDTYPVPRPKNYGCPDDPSWVAFARDAGWEPVFLGDILKDGALGGVNPNYYGMIESIACSRASVFAGTYWSTFTGYIHRLRGYHGLGEHTYYHTTGKVDLARSPKSIGTGYSREWRIGWTDDHGGLI